MTNLILNTDSYKLSHFRQYPAATTEVSSYIESRGGRLPAVINFGLQAWLKETLSKPVSRFDIDEAETVAMAHIGQFNRAGWQRIVDQFGGYLPLEIEALPEGLALPYSVPVAQVRNTDPQSFWLTSYIETALLRAIWYPSTVASISFACKAILKKALQQTAEDPEAVLPFMLHDFGARGATGNEAAGLGGLAHLVNFQGTDTLSALIAGRRYYDIDMAGVSIPASEHSTMTSWGKAAERDAYANMIDQFAGPDKVVAFVADSYDLWNAVDNIVGGELKEKIQGNGGRVVVRPDSGEPREIVPEVIERLMAKFGYRVNSKGYKVLPECIRIIQGDGVSVDSLPGILKAMTDRGLAVENAAFGMGGGLLQKVDRDTLRWAMKASAVTVNGKTYDVFKDPVTDPGKRSKAGRQAVIRTEPWQQNQPQYQAVRADQLGAAGPENLLRPVWRNGELLVDDNFQQVRDRSEQAIANFISG